MLDMSVITKQYLTQSHPVVNIKKTCHLTNKKYQAIS